MIKIYLLISSLFVSASLFAQNSFPSSGNVGIGTTNSLRKIAIKGTGTDDGFIEFHNSNNDVPYVGIGYDQSNDGLSIKLNNGTNDFNGTAMFIARGNVTNGNVGIGTTTPDAKLAVNGTVHAKEVRVDLNVPGADYVFEKNYPLRALAKVDKYISLNHHLPDVPTAKNMEQNGIDVSEMNMKLLQKVEELTLYLIEKDRQMKDLEKRMVKVEAKSKKQVP